MDDVVQEGGRLAPIPAELRPHIRVAWNRYRQYFWPLAALQFCAHSWTFIAWRASSVWGLDGWQKQLLSLLFIAVSTPFTTALLSACRDTIDGENAFQNPLTVWDRRAGLVLWVQAVNWGLYSVTLDGIPLKHWLHDADSSVLLLLAQAAALFSGYFIVTLLRLYLSIRLLPSQYIAAGGEPKPIRRAWSGSRGRFWELVLLEILSSSPAILIMLPMLIVAVLYSRGPGEITNIIWLPALLVTTFTGGFFSVAMTSYCLQFQTKARP
jgi:hypothetical protein